MKRNHGIPYTISWCSVECTISLQSYLPHPTWVSSFACFWPKKASPNSPHSLPSPDQPQPRVHWAQRCQRSRRSATIPRKGPPRTNITWRHSKPLKITSVSRVKDDEWWKNNLKCLKYWWRRLVRMHNDIKWCFLFSSEYIEHGPVTSGSCRNKDLEM